MTKYVFKVQRKNYYFCLLAGMLLFASGIHLAYSMWSPFISLGPRLVFVYVLGLCAFHVAAIVGSWAGAVAVDRWTKRTINVMNLTN